MPSDFGSSGIFTLDEFKNRGIIKLAPDVLVYINGDLGAQVLAPVSGENQNVSFNDGITSVSIQSNLDTPGSGNASIEITTPIYGENSRYWARIQSPENYDIKIPIFVPMQEVRIYLKGRFMIDDKPRYYPAFWGFIINVDESFSGGVYKISLQCADMLHWWQYSTINIHPVPASNIAAAGGQTLTAFKTIFTTANPFTIIYRLTRSMGMHEFVTPTWLAQLTPLSQVYPPKAFRAHSQEIMKYWEARFANLASGSILKMYGMQGKLIEKKDGEGNTIRWIEPEMRKVQGAKSSNKKKSSDDTDPQPYYEINKELFDNMYLNNFTVFFEFDKMGQFDDAEYMTKLEIATEVKNRCDYEFFQDVNGNWIFKPPFYNMNTKNVQSYNIKPSDVINCAFQTDAEGIVTVAQITTAFHGQLRGAQYPSGVGFHMDIDLAKKYGIRFKSQHMEYIRNARAANLIAMGYMSLCNSKCVTGSVSIPGRPEMRLGYPVYIAHKDAFYYVKSIGHSFDYGGSFTTTLSLEAERPRMYQVINGFGEEFFSNTPWKDMVYLYAGPAGDISKSPIALDVESDKLRELLRSTGRLSSVAQGRYEIVSRQEAANILNQKPQTLMSVSSKSLPFTDEDGYRVIGAFRYGRGIPVQTGTVIDEATLKGSDTDQESQKNLVEQQKQDAITMMTASNAASESAAMKGLVDTLAKGQEGIIPGYLGFGNEDDGFKISSEAVDPTTIKPQNTTVPNTNVNSQKKVGDVK